MGKPGKKASNIFQNPGIRNNNGVVLPKIKGVGSPLKDKGEIRDASEIMKNVPGYNPKTGTVVQGGTITAPIVSPGSVMQAVGAAATTFGLGAAAYADIKHKKRVKQAKKEDAKKKAEIKARNSKLPQV